MARSGYGAIRGGEPEPEQVPARGRRQVAGAALALVSGALFTANNFVISQLGVSVPDLLMVRTLMQMLIYTSYCLYRSLPLLPGDLQQKLSILLQGLMSSLTFVTALAAVSYMPVPDALCIVFSCPVVTILLSAAVLRDRLGPAKITAGLLLLGGVVLVCRPPFLFHHQSLIQDASYPLYCVGLALAGTSCVSGGVMNVTVSRCSHVPSPVLVNVSAVCGLVMATLYCLLDTRATILSPEVVSITPTQWATFVGLSVSGLVAFTTLTRSLQLASPSLVASLRCVELVVAFAVQSLLTSTLPSLVASLGGGLIILGVLSLAFQSRLDLIARGLAKTFAGKVKIYLGRARDPDTERLLGSDGNIDVY